MRLTVSPNPVPPGCYLAKLEGIQSADHESYGPGLRFEFAICGGPLQGRRISRTTGRVPSPTNALGLLLSNLLGRPLQVDEVIELDSLMGREFLIDLGTSASGTSPVEYARVQ